jgi:hypothetical protein
MNSSSAVHKTRSASPFTRSSRSFEDRGHDGGYQPQPDYQPMPGYQPRSGYQPPTGHHPMSGYQPPTGCHPMSGYQLPTDFQLRPFTSSPVLEKRKSHNAPSSFTTNSYNGPDKSEKFAFSNSDFDDYSGRLPPDAFAADNANDEQFHLHESLKQKYQFCKPISLPTNSRHRYVHQAEDRLSYDEIVGVRTMLKWYQSFTQQKQQEDDLEQVYVKSKQRFIDLTKNKDEDGKT